MHEGLRKINQVSVVVSVKFLSLCSTFVWILWRINFVTTGETLYTGHKGWFKAAVSSTLHM